MQWNTNIDERPLPYKTHEVASAIKQKDFARAMKLRDPDFTSAYDAYIESTLLAVGSESRRLPVEQVCY